MYTAGRGLFHEPPLRSQGQYQASICQSQSRHTHTQMYMYMYVNVYLHLDQYLHLAPSPVALALWCSGPKSKYQVCGVQNHHLPWLGSQLISGPLKLASSDSFKRPKSGTHFAHPPTCNYGPLPSHLKVLKDFATLLHLPPLAALTPSLAFHASLANGGSQ